MELHQGFFHVILNGQVRPVSEAKVSLFSPALFNSFGVYESIEVVDGVAFHLDEHLERLAESAKMIELNLPYDTGEISSWARQLASENSQLNCVLRTIALGITQADDEALVAILPLPSPVYPDSYCQVGATVITFEGSRPLPACKSLNTLVNYLARRQAERSGVHEAILCNNGEMMEGARSNIFAVRAGELLTPPADRVLPGITRDIVVNLAQRAGYCLSEETLSVSRVPEYDEFFVTSTSMHVIPIVSIDDVSVGNGQVGPVTQDLMTRFENYRTKYFGENQP